MRANLEILEDKRREWQDREGVKRFAEQVNVSHGPQHLKNVIETDMVQRYMRDGDLLDVGIGIGRVSLALAAQDVRLTGVDASAAMIERCAGDARAAAVRLVHADLETLPFASETFDTVMSLDTFAHLPDWVTNLDELVRVTRQSGRTIVNVDSEDHVAAVAQQRGCSRAAVVSTDVQASHASALRLTRKQLETYAAERRLTLSALVPYGAVYGSLVPNYWFSGSYAARSGALDRLVSWIATDPLLFAFAQFIERRIAQLLSTSSCGRIFVVIERRPDGACDKEPLVANIAAGDERGTAAWHAEFGAHVQHEPNRAFAVAFLLALLPERLPAAVRSQLPTVLSRDLERAERAQRIDELSAAVAAEWQSTTTGLAYHGVELSGVFRPPLERALRDVFAGIE